MKKRSISILLILLSLLMVFSCASCATEGEDDDTTTEQATKAPDSAQTDYLDTLPKIPEGLSTFNIMTIGGVDVTDESYNEDKSDVEHATYERDKEIEEFYKLEIEYTLFPNSDAQALEQMRLAVESDLMNQHVFITSASRLMNLAMTGHVEDLNTVEGINLDKEWWCQSLNENCKVNNTLYCSAGPFSQFFYHAAIALAVNNQMLDDYTRPDIFDLINKGEWTLAKMKEICKDITADDGNETWGTEDTYAISANVDLLYGLFGAMGNKFSDLDEDGNIVVTTYNETAVNKMNSIIELFNKNNCYMTPAGTPHPWEDSANVFTSGNALFLYTATGYMNDYLPESTVDYSIVITPKYDDKSDYITCAWPDSNYCLAIPTGLSTALRKFAGTMAEAYCYKSWEIVRPVKYDRVFCHQVAADPRSSEMMDRIFGSLYFDVNLVFNFGSTRTLVQTFLKKGNTTGYSSAVQAVEDVIKGDIQRLLNQKN